MHVPPQQKQKSGGRGLGGHVGRRSGDAARGRETSATCRTATWLLQDLKKTLRKWVGGGQSWKPRSHVEKLLDLAAGAWGFLTLCSLFA